MSLCRDRRCQRLPVSASRCYRVLLLAPHESCSPAAFGLQVQWFSSPASSFLLLCVLARSHRHTFSMQSNSNSSAIPSLCFSNASEPNIRCLFPRVATALLLGVTAQVCSHPCFVLFHALPPRCSCRYFPCVCLSLYLPSSCVQGHLFSYDLLLLGVTLATSMVRL